MIETGQPPPLLVEHVTFAYSPQGGAPPVLEDVSLRVEDGDFLALIGPNGGGKTTLLRIVLGLLRPQAGSVRVFGRAPDEARALIGYVPQRASVNVWAPASVLDVVLMGRLHRSSWGFHYGQGDVQAALAAMERSACAELARRPIGTLSGGQRQRVLIARALAGESRLLLLDEPTAGVDEPMQESLSELLRTLNAQLPIVIVTHDIGFVSSHVRHIACLNRTLACHPAGEVTPEVIGRMYHGPVRLVHHDHGESCRVAEP